MSYKNTKTEYGSVAKFFHWTLSTMVIGMLIVGSIMILLPNEPYKEEVFTFHKSFGLVVLFLMMFRLGWRFANPQPQLPAKTKPWEKLAEHSVQVLFYIILFAMPLSGWVMSVAAGYTPSFFWMIDVPFFGLGKNEGIDEIAELIHYVLAWGLFGLLSLHVLAALKHHFIDKDNILTRMMPKQTPKSSIDQST